MTTEAETKSIDDLISKVRAYNPSADLEFLRKAYWFSAEVHGRQMRKGGTPYIEHPLAVASILADMKMDVVTIATAILHDTVEDTETKIDDIRKRFGHDVAFLVEGLTKLEKIEFHSRARTQAENFRKMLLSMAEDVRVIIIKFADRLHNMRTLEHLAPAKQRRIAQETLEIYAPISNRLGIGWLKSELEDLSFKYIMPDLYKDLEQKVSKRREEHEGYIKHVVTIMEMRLQAEGIPARVGGRVKHYYSIYHKMIAQSITFEQVHDVLGIRVITDTKSNCYAILGLVHSLWVPVPGKFKDYIGVPKANRYQSLHTTIIGPGGERVEFQIRTDEMDRVANEGIAAHWKYKDSSAKGREDRYIEWLRDLVHAYTDMSDARELLEAVKSEVVPDEVYVFTPHGDVKVLPFGSTPIDFAYSIHTQVGHRCVGAKINGKMVPLKHALQSGDTIEILTSPSHNPSRDWMKYAVTQKAKARIRAWIKTEERKQSIELGQKLIEEELRKKHLSPSLMKSDDILQAAKAFNFKSAEDLFISVGFGKVSAIKVVHKLAPHIELTEDESAAEAVERKAHKETETKGISIKGVDGLLYSTARCCYPVPGDILVGFVTRGKGVTIHRQKCKNVSRLAVESERLIDVNWEPQEGAFARARIYIDAMDKPGIVAAVSALISSANINVTHLEANTSPDRTAKIVLELEVQSREPLVGIIQKIARVDGVVRVTR